MKSMRTMMMTTTSSYSIVRLLPGKASEGGAGGLAGPALGGGEDGA